MHQTKSIAPSPQNPGARTATALVFALAVSTLIALAGTPAHAQRTYYFGENTDYTGNGCTNMDNLNTVTQSLQDTLTTASRNGATWTGKRFVNAVTYPQDFVEACGGSQGWNGLDSVEADAATLAVFSGHGGLGSLYWGYPHNNACSIDFSVNMRLGSMAGAKAAYGMYLSCEALLISNLPYDANWQWVRQHMGFQNTIAIRSNEPRDFVNKTRIDPYGISNAAAWLDVMDGDGQDGKHRKPIVVSYGWNSSDCWTIHDGARLRAETYLTPRGGGPSCGQGQPLNYYCIDYRD